MDPICHTLVGGALARAGLDRVTPRALGTLIVAANLPDVDIVAAFVGENLAWRRGVTHGIPALALWPVILAGLVWLWDRWRPGREGPVSFSGLALVAAVGVVSHPLLDYLNNYGMRWLMPLRDQWYYGDSLFIVDPWLYLALGGGWLLTRRARRTGASDPRRPARIGVALAAVYIGAMILGTMAGRGLVVARLGPTAPGRLMVTPVPIDPLARRLVIADSTGYRVGRVRLGPVPRVVVDSVVPRGARFAEAAAAAGRTPGGRAFLHWSRLPVAVELERGGVRLFDLRYSDGTAPSWAGVEVALRPAPAGAGSPQADGARPPEPPAPPPATPR